MLTSALVEQYDIIRGLNGIEQHLAFALFLFGFGYGFAAACVGKFIHLYGGIVSESTKVIVETLTHVRHAGFAYGENGYFQPCKV